MRLKPTKQQVIDQGRLWRQKDDPEVTARVIEDPKDKLRIYAVVTDKYGSWFHERWTRRTFEITFEEVE